MFRTLTALAAATLLTSAVLAQAPAETAPQSTAAPQTGAPAQSATPAETPAPQAAPQTGPAQQAAPQTGAPASTGQPTRNADGTYTVRTNSRIVILDVVVLDAKGNIVPNLKRDDFHVTEQDVPQRLINFEEAGAHTPPPDAEINSTQELDQKEPRSPVNIILLDEFNTRFEDMAFARYSLKKYLDRQPGKLTMPTMLIAVSLSKFEVLQDYTQDRDKILNQLDHHFAAFPWQAHGGGWLAERYSTAFGTLLRVAVATEGHPGHKNMIWIGRGFPNLNLQRVAIDGQQQLNSIIQQVVNKLRDARVTLYTIDPAGVQINPAAYGQDAADFDPFGGSYDFNRLAVATGGRTFYGRNDVDAEIGTSLRDGSSFYTLVYRPNGGAPPEPGKFRKIKITFDNPTWKAVTRQGYYPAQGPGRVNPNNPSRRLAFDLGAAGNSTMVYDGVPLELHRDPANPDKFTVHVDGRGLNWTVVTDEHPARTAEVILMATTFDKKGKIIKEIAKNIRVAAPATVPPVGRLERSLDLVMELPHNDKAVRARFVVRVASTGRIGTQDAQLSPVAPVN